MKMVPRSPFLFIPGASWLPPCSSWRAAHCIRSRPRSRHVTMQTTNASQTKRATLIYSPKFQNYGMSQPYMFESPERVKFCFDHIQNDPGLVSQLNIMHPSDTDESPQRYSFVMEQLLRVHYQDHIDEMREYCKRGGGVLDQDTFVDKNMFSVALLAASAWLDGVDKVLETQRPSFVLARPPGHHATCAITQGFCMFSNCGVAAKYALDAKGLKRVAIVDFDVHHGNGTQSVVRNEERIQFVSTHQVPLYPGTGWNPDDHGPLGNIKNVPLSEGTTFENNYKEIFAKQVLPFLEKNGSVDMVFVSAGYDAMDHDPLGGIRLQPENYGQISDMLFEHLGHKKVLFGLEGGYNLKRLPLAVHCTLQACVK